MANTYTHLQYHCIWSTKKREPSIRPDIEKNVWALLAETATTHEMHIKLAGGIENHVHVLIDIPKTLSVSEAMKRLKGGSSAAINKAKLMKNSFAWQDGYAAFTVSKSSESGIVKYISNQRDHHHVMTFEEEFQKLLVKHEMDYDPQYLWG